MKFRAFRAAFPHTIPVLTGYLFLGMAYGMYMRVSGFAFWYPLLMAVVIYGGSLEFVTVSLLLSAFSPVSAFVMALLIQARDQLGWVGRMNEIKHSAEESILTEIVYE